MRHLPPYQVQKSKCLSVPFSWKTAGRTKLKMIKTNSSLNSAMFNCLLLAKSIQQTRRCRLQTYSKPAKPVLPKRQKRSMPWFQSNNPDSCCDTNVRTDLACNICWSKMILIQKWLFEPWPGETPKERNLFIASQSSAELASFSPKKQRLERGRRKGRKISKKKKVHKILLSFIPLCVIMFNWPPGSHIALITELYKRAPLRAVALE